MVASRRHRCGTLALIAIFAACVGNQSATAQTAAASTAKTGASEAPAPVRLRYKFRPGETLRWAVEQHAAIRTTVAGTTQTAETSSRSIKVWKTTYLDGKGEATFAHSVESVEMKQKLSGRAEVTYNSATDKEPPSGFEDVAKSVGVPLTVFTMDATGKILRREDKRPRPDEQVSHITVPLPADPVAVGATWDLPYDSTATTKDGAKRKIKLRQRMTLEQVTGNIATIKLDTQILSPVQDPTVEAQLVQGDAHGTVQFDIAAGRIVSQETTTDKHVVGFQGDATTLHYANTFTMKLLEPAKTSEPEPKVATRPAPATKPASPPATRPAAPAPSRATPTRPAPSQRKPAMKRR